MNSKKNVLVFPSILGLLTLSLVLGLTSCTSITKDVSGQWFRGNTHTHTTKSDGNAAPEVVVKWYHDRNYNFLLITDHNKFIDPKTIEMPGDLRKDFILIPGDEITGRRTIHTTAMNIDRVAPWKFNDKDKSKIIQSHVDEAIGAGGTAILNHPNFKYAASAEDISKVKRLYMFELFNGHPGVRNDGDKTHPSTEKIWDELLTKGMKMFAVASDDAHHYKTISPKRANPIRGWVMVQAADLGPDSITKSMLRGNFYASTGVFLTKCERGEEYTIEVDDNRTKQELTAKPKTHGKPVKEGHIGYQIEFIGPEGKVLETINGTRGSFTITESHPYVRARVTLITEDPETKRLMLYRAWAQPVFTDERNEMDTMDGYGHNKHGHEEHH